MGKYVVRSGQNLFDVSLSIYGSVEGVFDLLVCNESQSLSFDTQLYQGQILEHSDNYLIFKNVRDWFSDNNVKVANGEHIHEYVDIKDFILDYIASYNKSVVNVANDMFPGVWDIINEIPLQNSKKFQMMFQNYIRENYFGFGTSPVEKFSGTGQTGTSSDQENFFKSNLTKKRLVVIQNGYLSTIKFKLAEKSVLAIKWGDLSTPEITINSKNEIVFEHCYDDDGKHTISLYGNFIFDTLDLSDINGIYYPTSLIKVKDKFNSKLMDNNKINKLIILGNEQNT